jgi:peptidoglycan hydrolase CwlO-like protein
MFALMKNFSILLVAVSMVVFSGCGTGQKKNANGTQDKVKSEVSTEFLQEQNELLAKANQELSGINKKILELNDKIKDKGGKLTDAQNEAIDEFEEKRASVNKCMHQIKNISPEGWKDFKSTFEKDLEEVKSMIDEILEGI